MRKVGVCFILKNGYSCEEWATNAKKIGFDSTFLTFEDNVPAFKDVEKQVNIMRRNNIDIETIHAPYKMNTNDIWLKRGEKCEYYKALIKTIDYAKIFGIHDVIIHLSSGDNPPCINQIGKDNFCEIIEYAYKNNINLNFENQRKVGVLSWILENFNNDNVGFCWDIGHQYCFTDNIIDYGSIPFFTKRLGSLHISDNFGVHNQDDHIIPGLGKIDFNKFINNLDKANYQGTLMLELQYDFEKNNCANLNEFLQKAYINIQKFNR